MARDSADQVLLVSFPDPHATQSSLCGFDQTLFAQREGLGTRLGTETATVLAASTKLGYSRLKPEQKCVIEAF